MIALPKVDIIKISKF